MGAIKLADKPPRQTVALSSLSLSLSFFATVHGSAETRSIVHKIRVLETYLLDGLNIQRPPVLWTHLSLPTTTRTPINPVVVLAATVNAAFTPASKLFSQSAPTLPPMIRILRNFLSSDVYDPDRCRSVVERNEFPLTQNDVTNCLLLFPYRSQSRLREAVNTKSDILSNVVEEESVERVA